MATINFDAQAFESQQLPDPLPPPPAADSGLTEYERSFLGMDSQLLDVRDTPDKVRRHLELMQEDRARQAQAQAAAQPKAKREPVDREARDQRRAAHATVVSALQKEWRDAVAHRNAVLAELNETVRIKHEAYTAAKNEKVN